MSARTKPAPAVGQLWRIGGKTFRVETLAGDEPGFRIVLQEVERDASVNRAIRAQAKARHWTQRRTVLQALRVSRMTVDSPWFERSDVSLVSASSAAEVQP